MCGRFTITVDRVDAILRKFNAEPAPGFTDYRPRFNAAPQQFVPVIVAKEDGRRYLTYVYWSLTPPWAEAAGSKYSAQINIRDDSIDKNKYFRTLLLNQRCVFVTDGFFEWQIPDGYENKPLPRGYRKMPYRIRFADGEIMPLAGLWRTIEQDRKDVLSGAIITTGPNKLMLGIHKRMPVILNEKALGHWLDPTYKNFDQLRLYLSPFPDAGMEAYAVSTAVNDGRLDSEECIQPQ